MAGGGALPRGDEAASDFVGTMLMVVLVVALASVVAAMVATSLDGPAAPAASVSLASLSPGDAEARLLHRNGEPVPLDALSVLLQRGDAAESEVPRASWTTPDAQTWRPGERLAFPLSPPVAADERIRVRLVRTDLNFVAADLASRAGSEAFPPAGATLSASLTPPHVLADGVSSSLLAVRITHPEGALAVAEVVADLRAASPPGSAAVIVGLNDEGREGDEVGGDGTWSALVRLPVGSPLGTHAIELNLTDTAGRRTSATLPAQVRVSATDHVRAWLGVSFEAPTSENVTSFRLRNWTWDKANPARLDDDTAVFRIVGGNGATWTCTLLLEEFGAAAHARELRVSNAAGETIYRPRNGTRLALQGLDMDLMDPVASLQWVRFSGAAHPSALYAAAGVQDRPEFGVSFFGQDFAASNTRLSDGNGVVSVDVVTR